ncbi:hypothetical protein F2Q70_00037548 [Brassica cretica]|uniref:Exocyst complex component Sec8 n=1 Tax=Brassica cretica TaxID=69181 RepID=A0A8S9K052_BRACR|nr:hypothetical protein F2Q70_00037548 [Brassica cretica]
METRNLSKFACSQGDQTVAAGLHFVKGQPEAYRLSKEKPQNGISNSGTHLAVSPVSPLMVPGGKAQAAAKDLLDSILDTIVKIFENHVVIGELFELKASQHDINTPKSLPTNVNWNIDSEASQVTGGYTISYPLTVLQSECQQLICEILRATPEAASADAAAQTAKGAKKASKKDKRQRYVFIRLGITIYGHRQYREDIRAEIYSDDLISRNAPEDGLTFTFRFTDATISISNQGADLIRQGWGKKAPNSSQEGYGSAAVLPEQGIYLAASIYRPVLQFTDKITSMLPKKHSQLVIDGLLTFTENFVKDHLLPTMFVDYRKGVQQAISSKDQSICLGVELNHFQKHSLSPSVCYYYTWQAMAAIPYIDGESVQQNLDRVRTYFELLNMPFEALLAFIAEHDQMFTPTEYSNLLKVNVPGRDTPTDAQSRLSEILSH